MAIQPRKTEAVNAIKEKISNSKDFVITDYRGLTVEQITDLRQSLRELGATYHIVKNNFAKIAFNEMEYPKMDELFNGPTAIAFSTDEAGPVAKKILDSEKDLSVKLKGGMIDGAVYDYEKMVAYSKLPTKQQLLGMLVGTMNAPLMNLMYALNGVTEKLVRTIQAYADKKAEE